MKKNLLSTFVVFLFSITIYSQKLDDRKVPAATLMAFQQKYPGIKGKWEKENGNFEVNFKNGGHSMSAVIDEKGSILETETDIAINDLPASVALYVKEHYQGTKIKNAARIVKEGGEIVYEAEVKKMDVLFDANGKFLREEKD
jgi:Putative beta-lactamase-inhibitor-like, PepSY-like